MPLPTTGVMGNVSRPLIALLVGTVAFFALWLVALKPSSSSSGNGSSQGLGQYQGAINQAHNAVKVANGAAAAQGGNLATPSGAPAQRPTVQQAPAKAAGGATAAVAATAARPSTSAASHTTAARRGKTAPTAKSPKAAATQTTAERLRLVDRALRQHRVLAMLFYNPASPDDRAVDQELATLPGHQGRVVKLAVPISEVSDYLVVTNQVNVTESPTLVLINPAAQASTILGFADTFELAQRVDDALAVK